MENATKALLIAAAILIAILIISLSLVVYRMASETVGNVDLSEAEIAAYNSKFEAFEGEKISGAQVNSLLTTVVTHNQKYNAANNQEPNFVGLTTTEDPAPFGVMYSRGANNKNNIMASVSKRADTNKYYKVTCSYNKGLVNSIEINYAQ